MESEPKSKIEPGPTTPLEGFAPPTPGDRKVPYRDLSLWERLKPDLFIKAADLAPPATETRMPEALPTTGELVADPDQLVISGIQKAVKKGFVDRLRNWRQKADKFESSEEVKVPDAKPNRAEQRRQRKQKFQNDLDLRLRELVEAQKTPGKIKPEDIHRAIPTTSREARQLARGRKRVKKYVEAARTYDRGARIHGTSWTRQGYEESYYARRDRQAAEKAEAKVYKVAKKAKA